MTNTDKISMPGIIWVSLGIACLVAAPGATLAQNTAVGDIVCRCPGLAKKLGSAPNCEVACFGSSASPKDDSDNSRTSYDNEAARRAQRAQEAAAAERQRQQDEADRIAAVEKKRKEEEQAKFLRERDKLVEKLKGSIGHPASPGNGGLKGSSTVNRDLKELRGSDRGTRDTQGTQTAWKQLHCAAEIAGFALAALGQRGDYDEFGGLSIEALKSLDGQRLTVECHAAPPFPGLHGPVDMEQGKQIQRTILSRAAAIAERMKQRGDQPTVSPSPAQTATETSGDKMRRVQRELNDQNSKKVTGTTQHDMAQQERDRKELTKLILANNGLEKGELTSVSVVLEDDAPARPSKPGATPVPTP